MFSSYNISQKFQEFIFKNLVRGKFELVSGTAFLNMVQFAKKSYVEKVEMLKCER